MKRYHCEIRWWVCVWCVCAFRGATEGRIVATRLMPQFDLIRDSVTMRGQGLNSVTSCATDFIASVSGLPSKHAQSFTVCVLNLFACTRDV